MMAVSTILLFLSFVAVLGMYYAERVRSGRLWLASFLLSGALIAAGYIVQHNEHAFRVGKVCTKQVRDVGGEWTCDEWSWPD